MNMTTAQKRYRILYVLQPGGGGAATSLYDLILGLDKSRYEPYVLFYEPDYYCEKFEEIGAKILVLSEKYPLFERTLHYYEGHSEDIRKKYGKVVWKAYWLSHVIYLTSKVMFFLKKYRIDLIHNNDNLMMDRFTILVAKLARTKQVCHMRSCGDLSSKPRQKLAASVDMFIYVSQHVEKYYLHEGIPPKKGQVAYEGFDETPFQKVTQQQIAAIRQEFGVGDDEILISNLGRIVKCKGQDYFLEAISQVVQHNPNIKALIVGAPETRPHLQAYYQKLQQMVKDFNLANHVIFTGFRSDIPQIMAASDILVHSASEPEPFGRVIVEGMLSKRLVIGVDAGGVPEIIDDQLTGLLVPTKNTAKMAAAILWVINYPEQAAHMGETAQQKAKERFSIEQHVSSVQQIYQKILNV